MTREIELDAGALLPCPFCGGEAGRLDFVTVGTELGDDPNAGGSCISCNGCGASSPVHFDRKENLYSSWNERNTRAPVEAAKPKAGREELASNREHLTVTGKFQSDKYPWCPAGFVPLKVGDPMATDLLAAYAVRRRKIDEAFCDDLTEALMLAAAPEPTP